MPADLEVKEEGASTDLVALPVSKGELVPHRENARILAVEDEIADLLVSLPPDKRRKAIRRSNRVIRHLRSSAENAHLMGNVSIAVGGLGSAIGASGLLAVVAPSVAVTLALITVTVGGFFVAAGGFATAIFLGRNRISELEKAQHLEDLTKETSNESI